MMAALLGGEVTFAFASLPTIVPQVKAGTLRVLAISGTKRTATMPNVATMNEFLPGYQVLQWYGLLAPASTPKPVIDKVSAALARSLAHAKVKDSIERLDTEVVPTTPEAFRALIEADVAQYRSLIERAKIRAE
jgi:tripartite-type tricarboxylate transporter receptor subunit TctC